MLLIRAFYAVTSPIAFVCTETIHYVFIIASMENKTLPIL